jgi:hypothetical protein
MGRVAARDGRAADARVGTPRGGRTARGARGGRAGRLRCRRDARAAPGPRAQRDRSSRPERGCYAEEPFGAVRGGARGPVPARAGVEACTTRRRRCGSRTLTPSNQSAAHPTHHDHLRPQESVDLASFAGIEINLSTEPLELHVRRGLRETTRGPRKQCTHVESGRRRARGASDEPRPPPRPSGDAPRAASRTARPTKPAPLLAREAHPQRAGRRVAR